MGRPDAFTTVTRLFHHLLHKVRIVKTRSHLQARLGIFGTSKYISCFHESISIRVSEDHLRRGRLFFEKAGYPIFAYSLQNQVNISRSNVDLGRKRQKRKTFLSPASKMTTRCANGCRLFHVDLIGPIGLEYLPVFSLWSWLAPLSNCVFCFAKDSQVCPSLSSAEVSCGMGCRWCVCAMHSSVPEQRDMARKERNQQFLS